MCTFNRELREFDALRKKGNDKSIKYVYLV